LKEGRSGDIKMEREFMEPGKNDHEDKLNFIKFWTKYMKTHSDKDWSEKQNVLINSIIK
jgi:hypothetical protein